MTSKHAVNREKIVHKWLENPDLSCALIAKTLKLPRRTVSDVIKRYKETLSIESKPGSGRKKGNVDKKLAQKIRRSVKTNPGLSYRDRAKKLGTSKSTVYRTCQRASYKSYKAIKMPNRNDKQSVRK